MRELRLQFTEHEAERLEQAADGRSEAKLSEMAKKAVMEYVSLIEKMNHDRGHYPQRPHPAAFRRERGA